MKILYSNRHQAPDEFRMKEGLSLDTKISFWKPPFISDEEDVEIMFRLCG